MVQRPLKGSRISSFYPIKTLPSLASLDSAFQLQEYISLLIRLDVHDVETIVSLPGKPALERQPSEEDKDADKEPKSEVVVDEHCWIYEQLRCALVVAVVSNKILTPHKTTGTGPVTPPYYYVAAGMHSRDML